MIVGIKTNIMVLIMKINSKTVNLEKFIFSKQGNFLWNLL